jgi:hypothetical protein
MEVPMITIVKQLAGSEDIRLDPTNVVQARIFARQLYGEKVFTCSFEQDEVRFKLKEGIPLRESLLKLYGADTFSFRGSKQELSDIFHSIN